MPTRLARVAARRAALRASRVNNTVLPLQRLPIQIIPVPAVNNQADNIPATAAPAVSVPQRSLCAVAGATVGSGVSQVFLPGFAAKAARVGIGYCIPAITITPKMGIAATARAMAFNAGRVAAMESTSATAYAYATNVAPAVGAATGGAIGFVASSAICWAVPKVLRFTVKTAVPFIWSNAIKPAAVGTWNGTCYAASALAHGASVAANTINDTAASTFSNFRVRVPAPLI